jgi:3-hydroxy-5-methyl-1-naphthoate 3-O-methyltransferase
MRITSMNTLAAVADPISDTPFRFASEPDALPSPLPLMELSTGFWAFKTLAAAHELGLFDRLADGGSTTPPDKRLYAGWGQLADALRTNRPTTWNPDVQASLFDGEDPKMLALFWDAMHSLSTMTARSLGAAYDFSRYRRLLDIGGGSGAFDIEIYKSYQQLEACVFDLPHVAGIAKHNIAQARMAERIDARGGDFFGPLPEGYDLHLFSMILHDWNEEKNRGLLRRSFEALVPGGAVVISELLVNDDKTGPAPAALMSLNMLIETEGRNYTAAEYRSWLEEAGFRRIESVSFSGPGANGAVIGHK